MSKFQPIAFELYTQAEIKRFKHILYGLICLGVIGTVDGFLLNFQQIVFFCLLFAFGCVMIRMVTPDLNTGKYAATIRWYNNRGSLFYMARKLSEETK
ncbi:MAG: hypothetical protein V8T90_05060 [Victivallales bacterium]